VWKAIEMDAATRVRQPIPLWSLRLFIAIWERPSPARSVVVIPLPARRSPKRQVLTFPAAIAVPVRMREELAPAEQPLSKLALLALISPINSLAGATLWNHLLA
jgi:hypothetical protein